MDFFGDETSNFGFGLENDLKFDFGGCICFDKANCFCGAGGVFDNEFEFSKPLDFSDEDDTHTFCGDFIQEKEGVEEEEKPCVEQRQQQRISVERMTARIERPKNMGCVEIQKEIYKVPVNVPVNVPTIMPPQLLPELNVPNQKNKTTHTSNEKGRLKRKRPEHWSDPWEALLKRQKTEGKNLELTKVEERRLKIYEEKVKPYFYLLNKPNETDEEIKKRRGLKKTAGDFKRREMKNHRICVLEWENDELTDKNVQLQQRVFRLEKLLEKNNIRYPLVQ